MDRKVRFIVAFMTPLLLSIMLLTGCGSNMLGEKKKPVSNNINELIKTASTPAEFLIIIEKADAVLNDVNSTKTQKQDALKIKGTAKLGEVGIDAIEIMASFADLANSSTITRNIFDVITLPEGADVAALAIAAEAFNSANVLIGQSFRLSPQATVPSLDAQSQLDRGLANALLAIEIIDTVIDVKSTGNVQRRDETEDWADSFEKVMSPGTGISKVTVYTDAAIDAFSSSGSFSSDQLTQMQKLKTVGTQINTMHASVTANATSYTSPKTTTYSFSSPANKETNIPLALQDIFSGISE